MVAIAIFPVGPRRILHFRFQVGRKRTQKSTGLPSTKRRLAREQAEEAYRVAQLRAQGREPVPTLQGLVKQWVQAHALRVSPAHLAAVERFGRQHLGDLAGRLLTDCTTQQVEGALQAYLAAPHSPASGNQWLSYLRLLMGWAIEDRRMIQFLPYRVKRLKVQRRPKVTLLPSKAPRWFAWLERAYHHEPGVFMAILLMAGMGLRQSEAIGARWQWLDLDHGIYSPGQTKGREARQRPVPDWLLDRLRPIAKPDGLIAHTETGGKVSTSRIARALSSANEACGTPGITAHRLRATYATELVWGGVPITDVQWILGHADIRTTILYVGLDLSRVRPVLSSLGERWQLLGRGTGERPRKAPVKPRCEK